MKYSFEARMEAYDNRRKLINNNISNIFDTIEKAIDEAIRNGQFECVVPLGSFLERFEDETKTEINDKLSVYGYKVEWRDNYAIVNYEEG